MANTDHHFSLSDAAPDKRGGINVRKLIIISAVIGLTSGFFGSLLFIRFAPGLIPIDKRQTILQESSATVEVVKKVSPSVVSITSRTNIRSYFGSRTQEGAGTGIIISSDGLILTNKHVVPTDATTFSIFDAEGKEYKNATVVARDPKNDIALVKVTAKGLRPAELGDSSRVEVGQKVVAIGNALGQFQNTVTEGIVSGIGRPVIASDEAGQGQEQLDNLFQTDAAINPGNSGGPLVNAIGQVIAVNTAVAGDAQNIGFAIPINEARVAIDSYKSQGKITGAYLGVRFIPITRDLAARENLSVSEGALLASEGPEPAIVPGSPAEKAGLKSGDIIIKIGDRKINATNPLSSVVAKSKPGEKIKIVIMRDGKEQTVDVTLQETNE